MRVIVQRVKNCKLNIEGNLHSQIDKGLLLYVGITNTDTQENAKYIADKVLKLRIFKDKNGKLNNSVLQENGSVMVVSNFTIYGSTKGTNRPDFSKSANSEYALPLYNFFIETLKQNINVATGVFGANMQVDYTCDGPINLIIEK